MILDTSALVAIALEEPDAPRLWDALLEATSCRIGAPTMVETWTVMERKASPKAHRILQDLIAGIGVTVEPFTPDHALIARDAWVRYGKGSGRRAGLNYGDCMAYAMAIDAGEPLLFIGNDFIHTDVQSAASGHSE